MQTHKQLADVVEHLSKSTDPTELAEACMSAYRRLALLLPNTVKGIAPAVLESKWMDLIIRLCTSRIKILQRLKTKGKREQKGGTENDDDAS